MAQYRITHALDDSEQPQYDAACKALCSTVAPCIAACFNRVYQGGSPVLDARKAIAPLMPPSEPPSRSISSIARLAAQPSADGPTEPSSGTQLTQTEPQGAAVEDDQLTGGNAEVAAASEVRTAAS